MSLVESGVDNGGVAVFESNLRSADMSFVEYTVKNGSVPILEGIFRKGDVSFDDETVNNDSFAVFKFVVVSSSRNTRAHQGRSRLRTHPCTDLIDMHDGFGMTLTHSAKTSLGVHPKPLVLSPTVDPML